VETAVTGKPKGEPRDKTITLRLPAGLHDLISDAATGSPPQHPRSVSEEIRRRLEASLKAGDDVDPRFKDLLTTIAYAASAAAQMFPAKKVIVSPAVAAGMLREGMQIDPKRREVEDISAHWLFETCLQMLLDAFRPVGIPDSLPKYTADAPHAAQTELLRRADRIVGAALGTLGERGLEAFNRLAPIDQETIAASGPIGRRLAAEAERRLDAEETKP
jgi:hypothetical protein